MKSYTANLTANLTNEKMEKQIKSIDDLVVQNKVKYGSVAEASTYQFFEVSRTASKSPLVLAVVCHRILSVEVAAIWPSSCWDTVVVDELVS